MPQYETLHSLEVISGLSRNDPKLIQANKILNACHNKIALANDEKSKEQLNELILATLSVLEAIKNNESSEVLIQHCNKLHGHILCLPPHLSQKSTLASNSNKIAQACLFVLVFALAFLLAFSFQCWYFSHLTAKVFLDCCASLTADLVIPAATVGLFSFGLYRMKSEENKTFDELHQDVNQFCEAVVAEQVSYLVPNIGK